MSNKYKVAHIREQGVDLIITPLESSFDNKSSQSQNDFIQYLQGHAESAGLAGTVVPVWLCGSRMKFIAPSGYHPFFRGLTWNSVLQNINKELTCY
ncbi:hypothetical protein [Yersinia enterocolitica]|uniref:hypothetical protein n=1 Tax=Yersinia enterocolitica TaxID=630 RepID=UPI0021E7677F|nr:hypothetical protein [Yersinia enterocolitica]EKN6017385.1 hypothetical protein [Yersinia enterocolitica]MCV3314329.1 hypothetical protein [Yersinia enterocolitica]HEB2014827.1 hypothetical protein [Yersinia enterocolitica]